ncbi:DUF3320 domain-containing protein [Ralstonia pickettii]|uniref:DUF3320 domain-containing protein n=1 Tax=Ralstonia pickettii TaxID=329 RepID=UPI00386733B6
MPLLASQLLKVVETEGPVSQAAAFKRVTRSWGLSRVGSRIEAHLTCTSWCPCRGSSPGAPMCCISSAIEVTAGKTFAPLKRASVRSRTRCQDGWLGAL